MRDFFVFSTPPAEDERFTIVWREEIPLNPFVLSEPPEDRGRAFATFLETRTFVSEGRIRRQLTEMGLPSDDVEDQIERARRMHTSTEPTTWERTTRIGYRNEFRQEVIFKTTIAGDLPDQRVYLLRCGDCAHEHGANGCDIHSRRCPRCQADDSQQPGQ